MRKQRIVPGRLAPAFEAELGRLRAQRAIARLWNREPGLWKEEPAHVASISNRLGWLSVVNQMRVEAVDLMAFAGEVAGSGLRHIVLLGMGGSSLAPEVFSLLFPAGGSGRRFFVIDSTDPEMLREIECRLDLRQTVFIVASKSGGTIETLSQFHYFLDRMRQAGISDIGKHFIAITDAGSRLDQMAQDHKFLKIFRNPTDIGGRYSALSYFGLVPAALWGVDVNAILDSATEMMVASGPQASPDTNPALRLAAFLGAGALQGCDKLFLISPRTVEPLGNWIEQLVAESTGKEGRGIVPIVAGPEAPLELLEQGAVTIALTLDGHDDPSVARTIAALEERGAPVAEIRMAAPADLGAEFFRWEAATVLAGVSLAINPFDEPNVQESKDATGALLREYESTGRMSPGSLVAADSGIELFAESGGAAPVTAALRLFLAARRPGDYLALLAYVSHDAENGAELEALRAQLVRALGMPVLLGYGPRYLHSIGQLYKGGPSTGMFAIITSKKSEELPIPGAKYTFAQLEMAQALGDMQCVELRRRPAVRLHLAQGARAGLPVLRGMFTEVLAAPGS